MMTREHSDTLARLQNEVARMPRPASKPETDNLDHLWRVLHGYAPATRPERESAYRALLAAGVNV